MSRPRGRISARGHQFPSRVGMGFPRWGGGRRVNGRAAATRLDAIPPVLAPDFTRPEALERTPKLPSGAEMLVPVREGIMGVEERPLPLKLLVEGQDMVIGQHR